MAGPDFVLELNSNEQRLPELITGIFEQQVSRTPRSIAVTYEGDSLTYAQLDVRTNQLAHYLRAKGVGPDVPVAVCMERSLEMLIAVISILKAGGAYVPIDVGYPRERSQFILRDSRARLVLTQKELSQWLSGMEWETISPESCQQEVENQPKTILKPLTLPENLAYIIYTSGSSGQPKGVAVAHRGVCNVIRKSVRSLAVSESSRIAQLAALSFDASVLEIWMALLSGATLVLVPREILSSGKALGELMREEKISHIAITPSLLETISPDACESLHTIILGGESASPGLIRAWEDGRKIFNAYAPTEATIYATVGQCSGDEKQPAAGEAIENMEAYILDEQMVPVRNGETGEIFLGGIGLARCYGGRPDLTAEKFIPHPLNLAEGERLYRTGDLGRWSADGQLEFAGRMDHQIKLHGYRIELGEIEAVLGEYPEVEQSVVLVREDRPGTKMLVGYVSVRSTARDLTPRKLQRYLQNRLPEYMIPSRWVMLERFPLTVHGKVDRTALPAPEIIEPGAPPQTEIERVLTRACAEVLGTPAISLDSTFMELGGSSLNATQVASVLRLSLSLDLPLKVLLDIKPLREIANELQSIQAEHPASYSGPKRYARNRNQIPASFSQERVWFIHQIEPGNLAYRFNAKLTFAGELNVIALQKALQTIVDRHEIYRTTFVEGEEFLQQIIHKDFRVQLEVIDVESEPTRGDELFQQELRKPFDLTLLPLVRWKLIRLHSRRHILFVIEHHVVHDGWSFNLFLKELTELYRSYIDGRVPQITESPFQFADFARWQHEWVDTTAAKQQIAFWAKTLSDVPPLLSLPYDYPRPAVQTYNGSIFQIEIPADLEDALNDIAHVHRATLYMAFAAAFQTLLFRYSGQESFCVGTAVANRNWQETTDLIGMLVNNLALRAQVENSMTLLELVRHTRETTLAAYANQDVPFDRVVRAVHPQRDPSYNPIFQVTLSFHDSPYQPAALPNLHMGVEGALSNGSAKFDLNLTVVKTQYSPDPAGNLSRKMLWEYNTDLFDPITVQRMSRHFMRILQEIARDPMQAVAEVRLLNTEEWEQIVDEWNRTDNEYPQHKCVHDLFQEQSVATPQNTAVAQSGGSLTYGELNHRANQLCRYLLRGGIQPEDRVGICMHRSLDMVIAMLAVLKAGAAYLPLDPEHPAERVQYMVQDSGMKVLLTRSEWAKQLDTMGARIVLLDGVEDLVSCESGTNPGIQVSPDNLAYLIYTSGSTGKPKGVAVAHRNLVNLVTWHQRTYQITHTDRASQIASLVFDASVWELWPYLLSGSCVELPDAKYLEMPERLVEWLADRKISICFIPTPITEMLLKMHVPDDLRLRELLTGGDRLPAGDWPRLPFVVNNHYGPTENTVVTTHARVTTDKLPPIGKPIFNTKIYVLNESYEPSPIGVAGELYIGGAGLARGYWNQPSLTAERFVPDPFSDLSGKRLYKTGDIVRYQPDGNLEFLGRKDAQVKLRGYRIELGEIEAALLRHPQVEQAVVVLRDISANNKMLVGYFSSKDEKLGTADLRDYLKDKLPEYMVPSAFIFLQSWPLTATGKVDRKALPLPDSNRVETYREPQTPQQEMLCEIFAEALGVGRVGIQDNFFDLGGHSLMATRLVSRIRATIGVELPLRTLFQYPTVAALAPHLRRGAQARIPLAPQSRPERLPLSYAQQRLWFIDQLEGGSAEYNMPEALRIRGMLNVEALKLTAQAVIDRHESLRTRFTEVGGVPAQIIEFSLQIQIPIEDLRALDHDAQELRVAEAWRQEWQKPFNLAQGPLLRLTILKLQDDEHVLLRTFHHIVSDGWSRGVCNREFEQLYRAFKEGLPNPLSPLSVQYADFTLWQQQWLNDEVLHGHLYYWMRQLDGIPEQLALPTDRPRPLQRTFVAEACRVTLLPESLQDLQVFSRTHNSTLYMTLLSGLAVLFQRYSGQDDIVTGAPIANRQEPQLESLIGFFVNSLVLRSRVDAKGSFTDLLSAIRVMNLEAYEHQDLPFERLVEELSPKRNANVTPVFQVTFALQNAPMGTQRLHGVTVEQFRGSETRSRFDLELHAFEDQGRLDIHWVYNRDLFDRWRIEQMARHHLRVLSSAVRNLNVCIADLEMLEEAERQQILIAWNPGAVPAGSEDCLHRIFEQNANLHANKSALVCDGQTLTYLELNERANQLAHHLKKLGVVAESRVGLCVEKGFAIVIGVLAILKVGGAYVPLDPTHPMGRLEYIIQDASLGIVLTQTKLRKLLPQTRVEAINLDEWSAIESQEKQNPESTPGSQNCAYVIYTSGSTGAPKGVEVTHANVTRLFDSTRQWFQFGPSDAWTLFHSFAFDFSVWEIWGALLYGGRLVIVPHGVSRSAEEFFDLLVKERITVLNQTPSAFKELARVNEARSKTEQLNVFLRLVIFGGEALDFQALRSWLDHYPHNPQLVNMYGITETTVHVTYHPVSAEDVEATSASRIGVPIPDLTTYVLDPSMNPAPAGVAGELYVGGAGLARGYLNRPELTAQRFVPDCFGNVPGQRLYRSGDLAQYRPDGTLDYLGRIDHQVKIRGYRIELGEIEAALKSHVEVQDALVVLREKDGEKQLLGYVTVRQRETETEFQAAQIAHWQQVYESTYQPSAPDAADFNIVGWNSSYTGEAIPADEMRIWVDETVKHILALNPVHALEIGCGTGLLLTRLAGSCRSYTGLDFSAQALGHLAAYVKQRGDLQHVILRQGLAHELSFLADNSVDLVVLNSVVQYFPRMQYLVEVLEEALRVTAPGGNIFIGDVRSLPLLEAYHLSVQLHKSRPEDSIEFVKARVAQAIQNEEELVIDPAFFEAFAQSTLKIGHVRFTLKGGAYDNELSRFRYDVTLRLGRKQRLVAPDRVLEWEREKNWKNELRILLNQHPETCIAVQSIPDQRVAGAVEAARLLHSEYDGSGNVLQLQEASIAATGEDPDGVIKLAATLGVELMWQRSVTGVYDAVFNPRWTSGSEGQEGSHADFRRFGNVPVQNAGFANLGRRVQEHLRRSLPDYMVPVAVIALSSWPLTANGKIDRKALPEPDRGHQEKYSAPRTPQEEILCEMFADVLGLELVGIDENFFELGGHSLMATRLASRIRSTFGVELPLRLLFECPAVSELAPHLRQDAKPRPLLKAKPRPARLPLSYAQQRLWFIHQLQGSSTEYNLCEALRLVGELNLDALQQTVNTIVERHESLRTRFIEAAEGPMQVIAPMEHIAIPVEDLSASSEEQQQKSLAAAVRREREKAFDLAAGPLLRIKLVKFGERDHVLIRTLHHIVCDGWSAAIFNREFTILYEAFSQGMGNPLQPLSVQYADFSLWQKEWFDEKALAGQLEYWEKQLSGIPEQLQLPKDRPRPPMQTFTAGLHRVNIPAEPVTSLKELARANHATLYMVLLSVYALLLQRYSGQDDIVVGSPIANRQDPLLEQLIGFFVNSLVMRVQMDRTRSFRHLLATVCGTALEAYAHQDLPFEILVEKLAPQRSLNMAPVFQVVFALQNAPARPQQLAGLEVQSLASEGLQIHFDLELHAWEKEAGLECLWVFNTDLFDHWRIEQLARHYTRLLESVVATPESLLPRLQVLDEQERRQLLTGPNLAQEDCSSEALLPTMFEHHAARTPYSTALAWREQSLSYQKLNARVNQLARYLQSKGAGPERTVAVCLERSPEMVIALLAVLKSGAAYLPLSSDYPRMRLNQIMTDAAPVAVIGKAEFRANLPQSRSIAWLDVSTLQSIFNDPPNHRQSVFLSPAHPAYILYTSGTTGTPKGVVITHEALANKMKTLAGYLHVQPHTRYALLSSIGFDPLLEQVLCPLCAGAACVIVPDEVRDDVQAFARYVEEQGITALDATPKLIEILLPEGRLPVQLETLVIGGEALPPSLVARLRSAGAAQRIFNFYGPTEICIDATAHEITEADASSQRVPIGGPLPNYRVYVVDEYLEPVVVGVGGELYIGGAGLARGYLNRADLTAERFVPDPFSGKPGERLYRTGDVCAWRVNGELEFWGRNDHQVKVRGMRLELGEIETTLRNATGIQDALVVAMSDESGEKQLAGYVVPAPGASVASGTLRSTLQRALPEYMVPAEIVVLQQWPLTPNGKIDRKSLPVPQRSGSDAYREPRNPVEEMLCGIFSEILSVERVGIDDNFFELGGHSLLATRVASRARAVLQIAVTVRTLFESPTVAELAARLRETKTVRVPLTARPRPERLPLSYAQQRLWFLDQMGETTTEYNMPEALRLEGSLDLDALEKTINAIVERHESLRTRFSVINSEPVQIIEPSLQIALSVEDLSTMPEEMRRDCVTKAIRREWEEPFDLARGPLARFRLLKLAEHEHVLLRTFHHILSDGWSAGVFSREFMLLYEAFHQGRENPLAPLSIQYADFALWQREWLNGQLLNDELAYWKKQLAGIPHELALPKDRPRPAVQTFAGDFCLATLTREQTSALRGLGRGNHVTLYMALLSAFAVLLHRYTGQEDIVVGSAIANRQETQLEHLIGFFVNTLVMRVHVDPQSSFSELLARTKVIVLDAYMHQDTPFERLVERLSPQRSLNLTPLYQVAFGLQNAPSELQQLSGLKVERLRSDELRVRFDLEVHACERGDELDFFWMYNRDLFDRWRIKQMSRHYQQLLENLSAAADAPIFSISMTDSQERQMLLEGFNNTAHPVPWSTMVESFEEQARRTPELVAMACGEQSFSYEDLNQRANRLARFLIKHGLSSESPVGVALDRSPELVIAVLAIFKAGSAYLPLPVDYPEGRLAHMISDATPALILTATRYSSRLPRTVEICSLDAPSIKNSIDLLYADNIAENERRSPVLPNHPAYILYTSGSSGAPKGVMITHQALANKVHTLNHYLGIAQHSRCAAMISIGFDPLLEQVLCPLCAGSTCVIVSDEVRDDVQAFSKYVEEQRISFLSATPKQLETLLPEGRLPVQLETLVIGGEALPPSLVAHLRSAGAARRMFNFYGPTEICIDATAHELTQSDASSQRVPIGGPLPNYCVYVLDKYFEPVPVGVGGELYIGGAGLARGYLNRADLTAERFLPDPFSGEAGERLYRSGDVCAWRVNGELDFWGRNDHQVKVRGMRLELGEIESALKRHARVEDALVLLREERLCGYVIARAEEGARAEAQQRQIEYWRQVYESAGLGDAEAGDFNIVGWNSSYTGEAIPVEEMRVWVEETVSRIMELKPRRVLEIGCGTGLLLSRIAPHCESYIGLDFSGETLKRLGEYLKQRSDLRHVELRQGLAHELEFLQDDSVDLVVLNSVVQYFPNADYLMEVLSGAVRVTGSGGYVFVGDVRNLALLEAYHASVQLHKADEGMGVEELRQKVVQGQHREEELVVDAGLWEEMGQRWVKVGRVRMELKAGSYDNELSRFRYDLVLRMGKKERVGEVESWVEWEGRGDWQEELERRLKESGGRRAIGVRGVQDIRSAGAVRVAEQLQSRAAGMTVARLREMCAAGGGEDPDKIIQLARRLRVELYWQGFDATAAYNIIFNPQWREQASSDAQPWSIFRRYTNAPSQLLVNPNLDRDLQEFVRKNLPDYMVPSAILVVPFWPLTPNGKIDCQALPTPENRDQGYRAPRTPQEEILCDIFADVLSLERVSIADNFFELGGHSLLATQLISRVRLTFGLEVPLRLLFEAPSVAELAPRLQGAEKTRFPLGRRERPERLPLSYAQQRLWFIDQLEGGSTEYNMPDGIRLRGELDMHALERAVNAIVERHESLRTRFVVSDGEPVQVIEPELRVAIPVEDLSHLTEEQQNDVIAQTVRREWKEPFDLAKGPVLRLRLLRLGRNDHVLLRTFHHIVSDGWSVSVFNREFMVLYEAFCAGRENPLPILSIQYADFALWQREWLNEEALRRDLDYWKNQLAGIPDQLAFPRDRPRPEMPTFAAGLVHMTLSSSQLLALRRFAQANHATVYMALLSAFAVLLWRYSGETDIVAGSAIANRQQALLEHLIGFFVNSLVMRVRINPRDTFPELLAQVRRMTLEAYSHQDLPFERLVKELSPQRSLNVTPLYQVSFDLQNAPMEQQQLRGLEVEPVKGADLRVRFDLEVHLFERAGQLEYYCMYSRDLFDHWRMEQMARHYVRLVDVLTHASNTLLAEVSLLDAQERRFVLESFNATKCFFPHEDVAALVEEQVQQSGEALAIACGAERISYHQLNERANSLARWLVRAGAGPEKVIAVAVERSPELVIALLAVLKSGAAFLSLPFDYPSARLAQIISDAAPVMLIAQTGMHARLRGFSSAPILDVASINEITNELSHHNLNIPVNPEQSAYVLYTSGSSGEPKGVVVSQGALVNKVQTLNGYMGIHEGTRYAVMSSIGFDPLLEQILCPLCAGAACVIVPDAVREDVQRFGRYVQEQGITALDATPRLLETLLPQGRLPVQLQTLVMGGEVLPPALAARLHAAGVAERVFNFYGPTEACIDATAHEISAADGTALRVPIGVPLGNYRVYVLDEFMEPVPLGVGGELYIGGAGVARGYLKRAELTAERFVPDGLSGEAGGRLYRTGDVCAWRVDGELEFWRRNDQQVKVRGMRLELGEIEAVLKRYPRVEDALVVLREEEERGRKEGKEEGGGEARLCGYVIARPEEGEGAEAQARQIEYWRQVHESAWLGEAEAGDFNIVGWNSSYTGEPIAAEEMRVWVEETVQRIRELKPRRVLEIGCGTGLLLTRIAPECESYVGVDFSTETLKRLGEYSSGRADLKHVELRQGLAHDLEFIEDDSVDLVVLNSVVQYFPNADYLLEVLKGAVRVTCRGGHVFVGDVRSLALLEAYHASVQVYKAEEGMGIEELREKVVQGQHREEELVVDAALFREMGHRWEKVGRVLAELKAGEYDNELSRFRYDVTLGIGEKERVGEVASWVEWDEERKWREELEKRLSENGYKTAVGVKGVRDVRVAGAVRLREYLHSGAAEMKVGELREACGAIQGEDPNAVMRLARQWGVELYWQRFSPDGLYDVIFNPQWRSAPAGAEIHSSLYRRYTNSPAESDAQAQLADLLRDELRRTLPEYMVPPTLVSLLAWPLTPAGKIDHKALPVPERRKESYRAPQTSTEQVLCGIFAETLSLERIGLDDNFFDLGGHSLLIPRIRLKVRERLQRDISTMEFFTHPTIQSLAARLEEPVAAHGEKLSPLITVRAAGNKLPLFLVHPSGGGVKTYHDLARYLDPAQPVYAFQNHILGSDESSPYMPIEEMATRYIAELCKVQPHGPYLLGGWSMGGIVAFEMALQLESRGEKVLLVAMLDAAALPDLQQEAMGTEGRFAQELILIGEAFAAREGKELLLDIVDLEDMDEEKQLAFFLRKVQVQELLPAYVDVAAMRALLNTLKNADRAARNYRPRKYFGKVAVLRATEGLPNLTGTTLEVYKDPTFGWQAFCALPVIVHFVPGDHMRMAAEPHIRVLGATLQGCVDHILEEISIGQKE